MVHIDNEWWLHGKKSLQSVQNSSGTIAATFQSWRRLMSELIRLKHCCRHRMTFGNSFDITAELTNERQVLGKGKKHLNFCVHIVDFF